MAWQKIKDRFGADLNGLPLVLVGPILRETKSHSVTVWLALKEECLNVTLNIYNSLKIIQFSSTSSSIKIGDRLHILCITAKTPNSSFYLSPKSLYYYNLEFSSSRTLLSPGVLTMSGNINEFVYQGHNLPNFVFAPTTLNDLKVMHGSCRKPHGEWTDMLCGVDTVISDSITNSSHTRPHFLFLTGDQIYADDVAGVLLYMINDLSSSLFTNQEIIPNPINGSTLPSTSDLLLPGLRHKLMGAAGFIENTEKGLLEGEKTANSHLIKFSEFSCMYLFAWSDLFYPNKGQDYPKFSQVYPLTKEEADAIIPRTKYRTKFATSVYDVQINEILRFSSTMKLVRRALAHVPTYMVFDDHEITDDWFLNYEWCEKILNVNNLFGRRVITNGIAAYFVFQGWGNRPDYFNDPTIHPIFDNLLTAINSNLYTQLEQILLPSIVVSNSTVESYKLEGSIDWHFHTSPISWGVNSPGYLFIILDTRTKRGFPPVRINNSIIEEADKRKPAKLINEEYLVNQAGHFSPSSLWHCIILISPPPVFGFPFIESLQTISINNFCDSPRAMDYETWGADRYIFENLLDYLSLYRNVIILSGDVHYGFTLHCKYFNNRSPGFENRANFVQLTSSSLKNKTTDTVRVEKLPIYTTNHYGWLNSPVSIDLSTWDFVIDIYEDLSTETPQKNGIDKLTNAITNLDYSEDKIPGKYVKTFDGISTIFEYWGTYKFLTENAWNAITGIPQSLRDSYENIMNFFSTVIKMMKWYKKNKEWLIANQQWLSSNWDEIQTEIPKYLAGEASQWVQDNWNEVNQRIEWFKNNFNEEFEYFMIWWETPPDFGELRHAINEFNIFYRINDNYIPDWFYSIDFITDKEPKTPTLFDLSSFTPSERNLYYHSALSGQFVTIDENVSGQNNIGHISFINWPIGSINPDPNIPPMVIHRFYIDKVVFEKIPNNIKIKTMDNQEGIGDHLKHEIPMMPPSDDDGDNVLNYNK